MTAYWKDDCELFALVRGELFTAVVGDVMDRLGLLNQFLPPYLKPLRDDMVVVGRALPVLEADLSADTPPGSDAPATAKPFGLMFEALDDLKPGEVYLCTGASPSYALWGELMSTRAMRLQAAGAVVDGYSRDTRAVLALGFPTFSRGCYAQDQAPRGKVVDFRLPVVLGNVNVSPGDIVFGDLDGICIVPRDAEEEVVCRALEKARGEKLVKRALTEGMSACEAYKTFGIM